MSLQNKKVTLRALYNRQLSLTALSPAELKHMEHLTPHFKEAVQALKEEGFNINIIFHGILTNNDLLIFMRVTQGNKPHAPPDSSKELLNAGWVSVWLKWRKKGYSHRISLDSPLKYNETCDIRSDKGKRRLTEHLVIAAAVVAARRESSKRLKELLDPPPVKALK